jgi:hypothetical protein
MKAHLLLVLSQGGVLKAFSVEDGKVRLETAELPR